MAYIGGTPRELQNSMRSTKSIEHQICAKTDFGSCSPRSFFLVA
eukprot:SAG11_NODE_15542_length_574_cov_1.722105_1_plen_43_part_01